MNIEQQLRRNVKELQEQLQRAYQRIKLYSVISFLYMLVE
jgi:hypothetical protein